MRRNLKGTAGFTLLELLITLTVFGTLALISNSAYREFRQKTAINRAARVVAADAAMVRTFAIRNRGNVSLVANEGARSYEIRDAAGTVLRTRQFDRQSEFPLSTLDVRLTGDSLTFNSRGMLTTAFALIDVVSGGGSKTVQINGLGRSRIVTN